jgi:hypothetical protein
MLVPITLLLCTVIAAPARADTLQLLGPSGPVSPDRFAITVVRRDASGTAIAPRKLRVSVEGGALSDLVLLRHRCVSRSIRRRR